MLGRVEPRRTVRQAKRVPASFFRSAAPLDRFDLLDEGGSRVGRGRPPRDALASESVSSNIPFRNDHSENRSPGIAIEGVSVMKPALRSRDKADDARAGINICHACCSPVGDQVANHSAYSELVKSNNVRAGNNHRRASFPPLSEHVRNQCAGPELCRCLNDVKDIGATERTCVVGGGRYLRGAAAHFAVVRGLHPIRGDADVWHRNHATLRCVIQCFLVLLSLDPNTRGPARSTHALGFDLREQRITTLCRNVPRQGGSDIEALEFARCLCADKAATAGSPCSDGETFEVRARDFAEHSKCLPTTAEKQ